MKSPRDKSKYNAKPTPASLIATEDGVAHGLEIGRRNTCCEADLDGFLAANLAPAKD
jgi:hypothetical protein